MKVRKNEKTQVLGMIRSYKISNLIMVIIDELWKDDL